MNLIKPLIFCFGLASFSFGQTPPTSNTPTPAQTPIPGQQELDQAKEFLFSQTPVPGKRYQETQERLKKVREQVKPWLDKAKDKGNAQAELYLKALGDKNFNINKFQKGSFPDIRMVASDLSARDDGHIPDTKGVFRDLYQIMKRAAEQGNPGAQYWIGFYFMRDDQFTYGTSKDMKESLRWIRSAAEGGSREAQSMLGMLYQEGCSKFPEMGLTCDQNLSRQWYVKAAAQGDRMAQEKVAQFDSEGSELTCRGLLMGLLPGLGNGKQSLGLDEPITFGPRVVREVQVQPTHSTKRQRDYVQVQGHLHWDGYTPVLQVEKLRYIEDHGKKLLNSLVGSEHTETEVLVNFKNGIPEKTREMVIAKVGTLQKEFRSGGLVIYLKLGMTVKKALNILINEPSVQYAEPNMIYHMNTGLGPK